jgi:hypothetical protein
MALSVVVVEIKIGHGLKHEADEVVGNEPFVV